MELQSFEEMTRDELWGAANAGGTLIIPLGALEQHGPHLPTFTDAAIAEQLLRRAVSMAATSFPLVVAPTLTYGSSHHHLPFGGTLSVSTQTYLSLLLDIGRSAIASGFSRLLFFNGHGGNHELAILAARDLGLTEGVDVACGSWWQIASKELDQWAQNTGGFVPGHAGALESSLALTLFPQLVRKLPDRGAEDVAKQVVLRSSNLRIDLGLEKISGFTDSPSLASANKPLVTAIASAIARELEHFERVTNR